MKLMDMLSLLSPPGILNPVEEMMKQEMQDSTELSYELYKGVDAHFQPTSIILILLSKFADLPNRKFTIVAILLLAGLFIVKGKLAGPAKIFYFLICVVALCILGVVGDSAN